MLARIVANRISAWAERHQLLPQNQWGFRQNRSTADALFCARIVTELAAEVRQRGEHDINDLLVLIMIDITKAYTRIQRKGAWFLLSRLGVPPGLIMVLKGLHEGTVYQCRSKQGLSEPYQQATGFREGCATSPILYNLVHSFALKDFEQRCQSHLSLFSLPDHPFNLRMTKQLTQQRIPHAISLLLVMFADDTSMFARGSNHSFQSSGRLLGGWLSANGSYDEEDTRRLTAAKILWTRILTQLPRFGLTLKTKGSLVRATVFRCLLYGTDSRFVSAKTIRKWQTFANGLARYIANQRIRTMHDDQVTMQDVRRTVGWDTTM